MKPETLDTIIGIIGFIAIWAAIITYAARTYKQPCKWRINYWR